MRLAVQVRTRLSQKIEPTAATLTRTSAETLYFLAPPGRPVAKSAWLGSFEYELSDSGVRCGSTSTTRVSLGLPDGASADGRRDVISSRCIGSVSVRVGSDTVPGGGRDSSGVSPEDSTRRTNSASSSSAVACWLRAACNRRSTPSRLLSANRILETLFGRGTHVRARVMRAVGGESKADRPATPATARRRRGTDTAPRRSIRRTQSPRELKIGGVRGASYPRPMPMKDLEIARLPRRMFRGRL